MIGYLLERASGKPYESLLQEYICRPNGMLSTTSDLEKAKTNHLAVPYMPYRKGKETIPWEMGKLSSAGGIFSSVQDLSKLMAAQLEAYRQFLGANVENPFVLTRHKVPFNPSGRPYYGFGCFEDHFDRDSALIFYGHSGDVDGFASEYNFFPNQDVGLILLTSKGGRWFSELNRQLLKMLLGRPDPPIVEVSNQELKRYVGEYDFGDVVLTIFKKGNQLWTKTPNFPPHKIYPATANKFFYRSFDAQFEFILNPQKKLEKVIYTQNGKSVSPQKIK